MEYPRLEAQHPFPFAPKSSILKVEIKPKMWIAKPIQKLTASEIQSWQALEPELPLAQTLSWANAIEAVQGTCFLIFNPEEKAGGIVFTPGTSQFECINGPHLDWDQAQIATRQLATFTMAVSKLNSGFQSLKIKPRWESHLTSQRIRELSISPHSYSQAATLLLPILESDEQQYQSFHPRLRRTLQQNLKLGVVTQHLIPASEPLQNFVETLTQYGRNKGFTVPPLKWFKALILGKTPSHLRFLLGTATLKEAGQIQSESLNLTVIQGDTAHYLFGCETRKPGLRSAVSTSAVLHWETLRYCRTAGIASYDLNGYLPDASPEHSYHGVSRFKEQFAGRVIQYDVPEFIIET